MTQTTNLGLKKIDGEDNWRQIFNDHNQSMDLVDEAVALNTAKIAQVPKLQEALGIVCDGNKCAIAASVGQYIILKNSSINGLEDGLYTASMAIPANTVIDSTYLTAVSKGGFNELNSKINALERKVTDYKILQTTKSGTTNASGSFSTGMSVTDRIIVGIRPTNTTNGHYDFDAYQGKWYITGCPANTSVSIVILYVEA